ncbi:MAG: phosphoenolpyruvate synthase, partial [Candidatus Micrarchaeota archaeon]
MGNILWLKEIHKEDVGIVGGKGANLGEMANAGLPVPPAFVVTSGAYFEFVRVNGLDAKIREFTAGLNARDNAKLNEASERIKGAIIEAQMPADIRADIMKSYNNLCGVMIPTPEQEVYVAVRSSATAEDLPDASFAGQQATFLNEKGGENVAVAVQKCWASLFEPRAIFYRAEKGYDHLKVGIAVVVQEMIQAERSGVMFTVDPVSNDASKIVIESAYGLGEIVVSGSITPDRYTVKKENLEIVEKDVVAQTWMITKTDKGNEHVEIKDEFQDKQKISDEEINQLAEIGRNIEEHYGKPQDIEWATSEGKIYIVQSRPITTLKMAAPARAEEAGEERREVGGVGGEIPVDKAEIILRGLGASPGITTGKVKFIPTPKDIDKMEDGAVLVTDMTTPDFVPAMKKASAIVTNAGGATCHAAIVSRELGIPCVVGTKYATQKLIEGQTISVDAHRGIIYNGAVALKKKEAKEEAGVMVARAGSPVTGTKIYVNLGEPELADKVASLDVDGVGLLRAEFMIAGIGEHPRKMMEEHREQEFVDKLAEGMRTFAAAFYPRPVVYRATDFKTNEYRNLKGGEKYEPEEANPMMGYRGCARYIAEPDVFKLELLAMKKAREEYGMKNLWLMIPFVRRIGEIRAIKEILKANEIHHTRDFKLWIMVEVPS